MPIQMIQPKGFDIPAYKKAVDNGLLTALEDVKALFQMTYHNWEQENVPKFDVEGPRNKGAAREVEYSTESEPYVFVSNGTPSHTINAKGTGFMSFKAGGMPKTFPNKLSSTSGAPGTDWRKAKEVAHPGIEARNFPQEVVKRAQPVVTIAIQHEVDEVVGG